MRTTFLALLAVGFSVSPLCAQNSPAAAKEKDLATHSSALTKEERERAVNYLAATQKEFLAALEGLSETQWKWKPAPDRWSIAETAEHIALAEGLIWDLVTRKIMKSPAAPEKRGQVQGKEEMIMKDIPDRSRKANAPEQLQPTGKWPTRAALVAQFSATRAQEIAYLKETQENLRNHFDDHPFLETMDAWQWLILNGAHARRHTAQILEVKVDPNFPKS